MAQNDTIVCPADAWTELTDANITSVTFLVEGPPGSNVYLQATVGAPSLTDGTVDGSILYKAGQGERNVDLADLFPGVSGANRLAAHPVGGLARVFVSHG